jgi:hypothetical protein
MQGQAHSRPNGLKPLDEMREKSCGFISHGRNPQAPQRARLDKRDCRGGHKPASLRSPDGGR